MRCNENAASPRTPESSSQAASAAFRSGSIPRVGSSSTSRSGSETDTAATTESLSLAAREVTRMAACRERETERRVRQQPVPRHRRRRVRPRPAPSLSRCSGRGPARGTSRGRSGSSRPESGSRSPAAIFASVVLPLPFSPSRATISPRLNTLVTLRRAPRARRRTRSGPLIEPDHRRAARGWGGGGSCALEPTGVARTMRP